MKRPLVFLMALAMTLVLGAIPLRAHAATSHRVNLSVVAWNERSFPRMSAHAYDDDLLNPTRSGWVKAPAQAYLGSEFQYGTGEIQRTQTWARHHGLAIRGARADTIEVFHGLRLGGTRLTTISRSQGSHSPARHYVATWAYVGGFRVVFVALHLTNGCWPSNPHRVSRCRALHAEEATMRRFVAYEHAHGWTVVIGGDLNTMQRQVWGARQASTRPVLSMQTAVVPAAGVSVRLHAFRLIRSLHTDHPLTLSEFTLAG